jgi:hypothetical protein
VPVCSKCMWMERNVIGLDKNINQKAFYYFIVV